MQRFPSKQELLHIEKVLAEIAMLPVIKNEGIMNVNIKMICFLAFMRIMHNFYQYFDI